MSVNRKAGGAWKETRHDKWSAPPHPPPPHPNPPLRPPLTPLPSLTLPLPSLPSPPPRYNLAKEQGFRSRAAFKLIQLNQKFNFLSSTKAVLDLGAAPGGWLQVCLRYMPVSSLILGVDLVPIKPLRGVTTLQADLTTPECRSLIKKELQGWDVDLVLHDGAPNVAGGMVWSKDAYQQNELVIHSLRLATLFLRPGATFITKVFRSQDYNSLLWVLQQLFRQVDVTKPLASRNASAEIFIVCRHYLAPKHIDPFLLDPAHVFQQFDSGATRVVDVFKAGTGKKQRSRQGYADADMNGLIGARCDVMGFVEAEEPIITLGSYSAFTFTSDDAKTLLTSASTTGEIRALCDDLRVLGKGDFKALLRWRKKMRDWLKELRAEQGMKDEGEGEAKGDEGKQPPSAEPKDEEKTEQQLAEEEEVAMTRAIADLKARQLHRAKVDKRKRRERKVKATHRLLLNKNNLSDVQEMIGADPNDELFSLTAVTGSTMDVLDAKAGEEVEGEEEEEEGEGEDDEEEEERGEEESEDEDAYTAELERRLDSMFDAYKERLKVVERIKERGEEEIRQAEVAEAEAQAANEEEKEGEEDEDDDSDDEDDSDQELYQQMKVGMKRKRAATEQEGEEDEEGTNPLVVSLEEKERVTALKRAERWFQRDVFRNTAGEELDGKAERDLVEEVPARGAASVGKRTTTLMDLMTPQVLTDSSDDDDEDMEEDDDQAGRWLGGDDADADASALPLTRAQRHAQRLQAQPVKDRTLPGLASLGKTREAVEAELKRKERRAKKNVREERRLARKAAAATPSPAPSAPTSFTSMLEDDERHLLVDQDSAKKAKRMAKRNAKASPSSSSSSPPSGDFEEVPQSLDLSSDDDAVATTLALGTRMLQKRARESLLNSSYNRYAVDLREQSALPQWFQMEEAAHSTAQLPVTRDEVQGFKDRLKAINARPIKKVMEARRRKKVKTEKRWEKIAKKVDEVSREEGGSVGEKVRRMEALMRKKDKRSIRGDRKYFVTKKGGGIDEVKRKKGTKTGGMTVQVDRRLKKDKRGTKAADSRGKKKSTTANKRRRGS